MRLWPKHWHAETWICSLRGHVAPAQFASEVSPTDAALGARLADGRRVARCLRCDCWVEHLDPEVANIRYVQVPPIAELTKPRRDAELHDAIFMRLIALNKGIHAVVFTLLASGLFLLKARLGSLQSFADRILNAIQGPLEASGPEASRTWLARQLAHVLNLRGHTVTLLIVIAALYAAVEWVEAIGLWQERHWAEYLTVIATAGFLPLEIHELTKRVTVLRVVALIINVALVFWLVWNKRLFGVRGGPHAIHHETDWESILASPRPARGKQPKALTTP